MLDNIVEKSELVSLWVWVLYLGLSDTLIWLYQLLLSSITSTN